MQSYKISSAIITQGTVYTLLQYISFWVKGAFIIQVLMTHNKSSDQLYFYFKVNW